MKGLYFDYSCSSWYCVLLNREIDGSLSDYFYFVNVSQGIYINNRKK
jgi:hypothetical protein